MSTVNSPRAGLRCAVLLWPLVATGCTNRHVLSNAPLERLTASIRAGDTVRVTTRDNATQKLDVVAIDSAGLSGVTAAGLSVVVPVADISSVTYRRLAIGRTVGLVVGVVGLLGMHDSCKPHDEYGKPACAE